MRKLPKTLIVLTVAASLNGCAAIHTGIAKRNLEVSTQASDTIFLDPVSSERRTVYIDVRNTSDKEIHVMDAIKARVESRGYRVIDNPNVAQYWLQANILKVSKGTPGDARNYLKSGYGGALAGGAIGGAIGTGVSGGLGGLAVGGLAGAALGALTETAVNSMVQDVMYYVVTDVQIAEKTSGKVNQSRRQSHRQGRGGNLNQSTASVKNRIYYQTRIVSTANKVNLDFVEASPVLGEGLSRSIAGFF